MVGALIEVVFYRAQSKPKRARNKGAFTPWPHYPCSWLACILTLSLPATFISSSTDTAFNYQGALMNHGRTQRRHCGLADSLRLMSQRANRDDQGCLQRPDHGDQITVWFLNPLKLWSVSVFAF